MRVQRITSQETLPLRKAVLRPGLPLTESRFDRDQEAKAGHFGVFDGEELVSVGTVYPEPCQDPNADEKMRAPGAWRLRGMATDPGWRSQGAGSKVLEACLAHAEGSGSTLVWCNARTGAVPFYERHGFQKKSAEYEMPGIGPHFLMVRYF